MDDSAYVGRTAPEFKLAAAHGGDIGPQDFRGSKHVVLWFSKGLFCPFCRRNMAQLALRYPRSRDSAPRCFRSRTTRSTKRAGI
jgi:peroxiredoxin